jgi:hypothetical protein
VPRIFRRSSTDLLEFNLDGRDLVVQRGEVELKRSSVQQHAMRDGARVTWTLGSARVGPTRVVLDELILGRASDLQ